MTYEITRPTTGRRPDVVATVEADDARAALTTFAVETLAIDPEIRRDGGGLLYVGNGHVGRYRARRVLVPTSPAFTKGQPAGMPLVLAAAIEGSDWS